MKDIEKKDAPDVSGGYTQTEDGCIPPFAPQLVDYPPIPFGPFPEPIPGPNDGNPYPQPK